MNVQIGANDVLLNLDRNQQAFEKTVSQLSSGLRINSAADDPSGNSIAVNLTSKVGGLQQAANNVQNGINALNVANGALKATQDILIRINTLIVESNSDINSASDLQNIQAEINALLIEINQIGEKTNFNGRTLLDGAFDTSLGSPPTLTQVSSAGGTGPSSVAAGGPLVSFTPGTSGIPNIPGTFVPAMTTFTVTAFDPSTSTYTLEVDVYSTSALLGPAPVYSSSYQFSGPQPAFQFTNADNSQIILQNVQLASTITAADVGASISFLSTNGQAAGGGQALTINDGGDEGDIVSLSLPTVNTNALNLSEITVLAPQVEDAFGNVGQGASNNLAASYAEVLVGNALTQVTTNEAQIGAQVVAMTADESGDNVTATNLAASASNITDLNVGQATTNYTREQILTSVGTDVLSQINSNGKIMTALLIQALIA